MRRGFATPIMLAIVVIIAVAIGIGISTIVYNKLNHPVKSPHNEFVKQIEEKYSRLSPELQHKISNNEELTEEENKELLRIEIGDEEINKIKNKSADQKHYQI